AVARCQPARAPPCKTAAKTAMRKHQSARTRAVCDIQSAARRRRACDKDDSGKRSVASDSLAAEGRARSRRGRETVHDTTEVARRFRVPRFVLKPCRSAQKSVAALHGLNTTRGTRESRDITQAPTTRS